jgi:hypothetical protein
MDVSGSLERRVAALKLADEQAGARLGDLEARATALTAAVEERIPQTTRVQACGKMNRSIGDAVVQSSVGAPHARPAPGGKELEAESGGQAGPGSACSVATQQATAEDFAAAPLGHAFVVRRPMTRVNGKNCAACSESIYAHHRSEVEDVQLLEVINAVDPSPTEIIAGEILVGGEGGARKHLDSHQGTVCVNCAGHTIHKVWVMTRPPWDALRAAGRVMDLEWVDDAGFELPLRDIIAAVAYIRGHVAEGSPVVINCAQGKSRSATVATAYLMASRDIDVESALALVKAKRPLSQPNAGFMKCLKRHEAAIREVGRSGSV